MCNNNSSVNELVIYTAHMELLCLCMFSFHRSFRLNTIKTWPCLQLTQQNSQPTVYWLSHYGYSIMTVGVQLERKVWKSVFVCEYKFRFACVCFPVHKKKKNQSFSVCVCVYLSTHKLFVFQGGPSGQCVGESSFPGLYHRLETRRRKKNKHHSYTAKEKKTKQKNKQGKEKRKKPKRIFI